MGKVKPKVKKPIEENEFLNDLIDEVKAQDNSEDEVSDDLSERFNVLAPNIKNDSNEKKNNLFLDSVAADSIQSDQINSDDLPTVFKHIRKDIKAPKLRQSLYSNQNDEEPAHAIPEEKPEPLQIKNNDKTVPSMDSAGFSGQETSAQRTSTSATMGASTVASSEPDRTIAVEGARGGRAVLQERVVTGALKGTRNGQVYTSLDASLAQAETLKIAQSRIKELEVEIDRLRTENDDLASAGDVVTRRVEDLQIRLHRLEKEKHDLADQSKSELLILRGNLQFKDSELSKTKAKLEDLDMRMKSDFRKIRVRERELENRLELVRGEKQALMRAKDEKILDLQRKLDQYKSELDLYRAKVQDLNKIMENQHDQMQKTIRALRIALVNLEHEDSSDTQTESSSEEDSDEMKKAK